MKCKAAAISKHPQIAPWHNYPILGHRYSSRVSRQFSLRLSAKGKEVTMIQLILGPISSNTAKTDMFLLADKTEAAQADIEHKQGVYRQSDSVPNNA